MAMHLGSNSLKPVNAITNANVPHFQNSDWLEFGMYAHWNASNCINLSSNFSN